MLAVAWVWKQSNEPRPIYTCLRHSIGWCQRTPWHTWNGTAFLWTWWAPAFAGVNATHLFWDNRGATVQTYRVHPEMENRDGLTWPDLTTAGIESWSVVGLRNTFVCAQPSCWKASINLRPVSWEIAAPALRINFLVKEKGSTSEEYKRRNSHFLDPAKRLENEQTASSASPRQPFETKLCQSIYFSISRAKSWEN